MTTMEFYRVHERLIAKRGDLTREDVDAIVNAANSSLLGGGGVDGAIHRAGGPEILEACRAIRASRYPQGLPAGEAVITTAGRMPARHVIHTVGPIYGEHAGKESELLAACYVNAVALDFNACPHCGHRLSGGCPKCGRALQPGWSFCPFCASATAPGKSKKKLREPRTLELPASNVTEFKNQNR